MPHMIDELEQSADKQPRTIRLSLRPTDVSLVSGLTLDDNISLTLNGRITSVDLNTFSVGLELELDNSGLGLDRNEQDPVTFADQVIKMKVLKS